MALRLAGEEFNLVQGLDALGWPREVEANDANPGLKITQSGSGPALQVVSGDIALGANRLKTTNLLVKQESSSTWALRNVADNDYASLRGQYVIVVGGIESETSGGTIRAINADNGSWILQARDNGVGMVEIARMQGAADPYFQATLALRLNPIATASLPATPVEGMMVYDDTANKLKFYNGAAWETVTSA